MSLGLQRWVTSFPGKEKLQKLEGLLKLHYQDEVDAVMTRRTTAADLFHKSRSCSSDMTSGFQLLDELSTAN